MLIRGANNKEKKFEIIPEKFAHKFRYPELKSIKKENKKSYLYALQNKCFLFSHKASIEKNIWAAVKEGINIDKEIVLFLYYLTFSIHIK